MREGKLMELIRIYEVNVFKYSIIAAVSIDEAVSHFVEINRGKVRDVRFDFTFIKDYTSEFPINSPAHRYYADQIDEGRTIPCTVVEATEYCYD